MPMSSLVGSMSSLLKGKKRSLPTDEAVADQQPSAKKQEPPAQPVSEVVPTELDAGQQLETESEVALTELDAGQQIETESEVLSCEEADESRPHMNVNHAVTKPFHGQSPQELLAAPPHAIEGIPEHEDPVFAELGINNLGDLATDFRIRIPQAIKMLWRKEEPTAQHDEEEQAGQQQQHAMNINSALEEPHQNKSFKGLHPQPMSVFAGSACESCGCTCKTDRLWAEVGIKAIKQVCDSMRFEWVRALFVLAMAGQGRSSLTEEEKDFTEEEKDFDGGPGQQQQPPAKRRRTGRMNVNHVVTKEFHGYRLREILDAPPHAIEGIPEHMVPVLEELGIKNVRDLGAGSTVLSRLIRLCWAITALAPKEEAVRCCGPATKNMISNLLKEPYQAKSLNELLSQPVSALKDCPEGWDELLADHFGIRTMKQLGSRLSFLWPWAVADLAEFEQSEELALALRAPAASAAKEEARLLQVAHAASMFAASAEAAAAVVAALSDNEEKEDDELS